MLNGLKEIIYTLKRRLRILHVAGLIVFNGPYFRQPTSRLAEFVRRKKLHWRATDACSCKSKCESLPTSLSNDGDLGNFTRMREIKIEIIPIRAALPAFKVLKNHEQTRFRSAVDIAGECLFLCAKFGSFQNAADA